MPKPKPRQFEMIGEIAVLRLTGEMSLDQASLAISTAITDANMQKFHKLLIVAAEVTGFDPPHLASRYFIVSDWAAAAGGLVQLAFVARPEMIDPQKFGVTLAKNLGTTANVFTNEKDALDWLQTLR